MRERFPNKRPGDALTAAHVNDLSSVARRFARFKGGGGLYARHSDSFFSISSAPPFNQGTLFVYALPTDVPNLYGVRTRFYNHTSNEWETDANSDYELDSSDFGAKLLIGDLITGYWNDQRGAFIPCWVPTDRMGIITEALGIGTGSSGEITLYNADKTPTDVVVTGYHTWMVGSDPLLHLDEVAVGYRTNADGVGRYIITNADCPTA